MHKLVSKIGTRGEEAPESGSKTENVFKECFERISKERYEEHSRVTAGVIERKFDLREDERARIANEMPDREKFERALKEMNDSCPGKEGVR